MLADYLTRLVWSLVGRSVVLPKMSFVSPYVEPLCARKTHRATLHSITHTACVMFMDRSDLASDYITAVGCGVVSMLHLTCMAHVRFIWACFCVCSCVWHPGEKTIIMYALQTDAATSIAVKPTGSEIAATCCTLHVAYILLFDLNFRLCIIILFTPIKLAWN